MKTLLIVAILAGGIFLSGCGETTVVEHRRGYSDHGYRDNGPRYRDDRYRGDGYGPRERETVVHVGVN